MRTVQSQPCYASAADDFYTYHMYFHLPNRQLLRLRYDMVVAKTQDSHNTMVLAKDKQDLSLSQSELTYALTVVRHSQPHLRHDALYGNRSR